LDVSNFDTAFTGEEAIISVVNPSKQGKIEKNKAAFADF